MRISILAAAFICLAAMVSCGEKPSATYMLRPHEELPEDVAKDRSYTAGLPCRDNRHGLRQGLAG